jgi:hypothetical protein
LCSSRKPTTRSWSPTKHAVDHMGYFEGSTLAVMEPGARPPFRRLRSDGPVCCFFSWSADGQSVFAANPSFGVTWPGLWEYDAETGEESVLVATVPGSEHYVGWPAQIPGGDLIYFHGEQFSPDEGIPLVMVRSRADGSDRSARRRNSASRKPCGHRVGPWRSSCRSLTTATGRSSSLERMGPLCRYSSRGSGSGGSPGGRSDAPGFPPSRGSSGCPK